MRLDVPPNIEVAAAVAVGLPTSPISCINEGQRREHAMARRPRTTPKSLQRRRAPVPSGQLELPLPDPNSRLREDELFAAALQRLRSRWGWPMQEFTLSSCVVEHWR
jgi:hypothetical protein